MVGTDPPACYRHRDRPAPVMLPAILPAPTPRAFPATPHFYFPHPTSGEAQAAAASELGADLQAEITLVRVMLRRLMAHLEASAEELPPEEVRRLAGLVFTGARTVAHLLGQRSAKPDEARAWMDSVMAAFAETRGEER